MMPWPPWPVLKPPTYDADRRHVRIESQGS
jgi:hypothetical protein